MKRIMCFGTFDKLHPGHLFYLKKSKNRKNFLIVVVARDDNVAKIKNKKPFDDEKTRLKNIKNLDFVEKAVLGNKRKKYAVINKYRPDVISLGYDQKVDMDELKKIFSGRIVRQKAFKPSLYKSSLIK